jgi:hypothetical protein
MHDSQNIKKTLQIQQALYGRYAISFIFQLRYVGGKEITITRISSVSPTTRLRSEINGKENHHSFIQYSV